MASSSLSPGYLCILFIACTALFGCSRAKYSLRADRDAYAAIAEKNSDPRWAADNVSIEMDPRSRYFETYSQDCPPLPPDDPTSHQYMHGVDGKKGWKHWHRNGNRVELENPIWRDSLFELTSFNKEGAMRLDLDTALRLAYVHSPTHQRQLETLYLTALDVTAERFNLDTRFFGGYDVAYQHDGSIVPAQLSFDSTLDRFVVEPPRRGEESNRLTIGAPDTAQTLSAERTLATAGELIVGFANSFVFEFTGEDANLAASLLNFSFIQPLLRGAGRDRALEALTLVERKLLANLRAYAQFRQGFYTQVAIGELGVNQLNRSPDGTTLRSFGGSSFVGGYLGLLQQLQQIRNAELNLSLQRRTLARLMAFERDGIIGRVQVEQFNQNIQAERDSLLRSRANYELALDRFKTDILGLPPDIEVELDDSILAPFRLIPPAASAIQNAIFELQVLLPEIPQDPSPAQINAALRELHAVVAEVKAHFDSVDEDVALMSELPMESDSHSVVRKKKIASAQSSMELAATDRKQELQRLMLELEEIQARLTDANTADVRLRLIGWTAKLLFEFEQTVLVQARARLEAIDIPRVDLASEDAYQIALANRLDFMNGRAALVDTWRLIQVSADALQADLTIRTSGQINTDRNNPLSFRAATGNARLALEFDAPFARLLERNAYRESLINYQQSRRSYIQSRDGLNLGLRALLRNLEQLRASLEIQRQSVAIAITRVDLTQKQLITPPNQNFAGQRFRLDPTTAINLLSAQQALRNSQNAILDVWLSYIATRMRLYRELGIMSLDSEGQWLEYPLPGSEIQDRSIDWLLPNESDLPPLPPSASQQYIDLLGHSPDDQGHPQGAQIHWVTPFEEIKSEPTVIRLSAEEEYLRSVGSTVSDF